jgi:hypothetical protein
MRKPLQTQTATQILSAIALFCYSASVAAMLILGYCLIALALNIADPQIGSVYSHYGM